MNTEESKRWTSRVTQFELALSIIAGLIEVGLFLSYMQSIITPEYAALAGLVVVTIFLMAGFLGKRSALKSSTAISSLRLQLPAVASFVEAWQQLSKDYQADGRVLYESVTHTFTIRGHDGEYTRRIVGHNVSDEELTQMVYLMTGETSTENGSLNVEAFRRLENTQIERLYPTVVWSSKNVKVVGVEFNPPIVSKVGKMDVTFLGRWPRAFVSKNGYVFAAISQCVLGCKKLIVEAVFEEPVLQCSLWTWDIRKHKLDQFEKLRDPKRKNGGYTLKWQRTNPDPNKIYIFRYKRVRNDLI